MSPAPPNPPFATVLLLAIAGFVSGASMRVTDPLLPTLAGEYGVRVADTALVLTAFTFAYGAFQAIHGPLGDGFGKLRVIAVALVLAAVSAAACAFAGSLATLIGLRFLTGMASGAVIPLSFAFIGDRFPYEGRQAILGRFIAGTLLGQSFGPLLGGLMSDAFGWRSTFGILAASFFGVALLVGREASRHGDKASAALAPPWRRYATILRSAKARPVLFTVGLEGFLFFGAFGFAGAYFKEAFRLSDTLTGLLVAGLGIGGLAYSFLVRRLVRRLGETGLVAGGGVLLFACFSLIAWLPAWWAAAPCVILLGFAFYMLHNTLQTRGTEIAPEARGAGVSLFAMCMFLGQAAGVAVFGQAIARWGYAGAFVFAGAALLALALRFRRSLLRMRTA